MYALKKTTTSEFVSDAQAREYLNLESDERAPTLDFIRRAVTNEMEERISEALDSGTWELPFASARKFTVPGRHGLEITSVLGSSGDALADADYEKEGNTVTLADGVDDQAATVVYTAGYGDSTEGRSQQVRLACLQLIAQRTAFRGDESRPVQTPFAVDLTYLDTLQDYAAD